MLEAIKTADFAVQRQIYETFIRKKIVEKKIYIYIEIEP